MNPIIMRLLATRLPEPRGFCATCNGKRKITKYWKINGTMHESTAPCPDCMVAKPQASGDSSARG